MEREDNEKRLLAKYNPDLDQLRGLVARLEPGSVIRVLREAGFPVGADIKPSKACGGEVSRTATNTGVTQEAAEDAALATAQAAAQRACQKKQCGEQKTCNYVEKGSTGSSGPVVPATNPATFTATVTTTGSCSCEGPGAA